MLDLGLYQCSNHTFIKDRSQGSISWIPKKASNVFEAFEAVFMEL